jgi:RNA-directed DNA polymerase
VGKELNLISEQSKKYPKVQNLMRYVNKENLLREHRHMNPKKAVGVDGITKEMYEKELNSNIDKLIVRMKRFSYRPKPTRKVEIMKDNGKKRPLGISSYEDKLVEGVMAEVLSAVYEPRFHNCSYGFRPKRNMHQAIGVINHSLMFEKMNYVIDFDIEGCFDNMEQEWLMKFLENDIEDRNYLRYIVRFLKSGIMKDGIYEDSDVGVKQGNRMSPVLANVYLHYVLDEWIEKGIRKHSRGNVRLVRFADDSVILCQNEQDAKEIFALLPQRLAKFNLKMNNIMYP